MSADYRRYLPHWHPDSVTYFVTWRLHGAYPDRPGGPTWLADPRVAGVVVGEILKAKECGLVAELFAWVVMPNHVHLLLRPAVELTDALRRIKDASARKAYLELQRSGRFWLEESYDPRIRGEWEFRQCFRHITRNPVVAGLASEPEAFRWSSAGWLTG